MIGVHHSARNVGAQIFALRDGGAQSTLRLRSPQADVGGRVAATEARIAIVGAPRLSSAREHDRVLVYERSGREIARLMPRERQARDDFGESLAIDGLTVVVGAPGTWSDGDGGSLGAVYVFEVP